MRKPSPLKLNATSEEDLETISAACQDAIIQPKDFRYFKRARRFTVEMNRFHWEVAGLRKPYFRSRSVLGVDFVTRVQSRGMPDKYGEVPAQLLAIQFEKAQEPPSGVFTMLYAGGGEVRLEVECVDLTLLDSNQIWPTSRRPDHQRIFR